MAPETPARGPSVVVVQPRPVVAAGWARVIADMAGTVLEDAVDATTGLRAIERHQPDLAIIDLDLPDRPGLALTEEIVERGLRSRVLLFGDRALAATWDRAAFAGATGLVLSLSPIAELERAVTTVIAGGRHLDPRLGPGGAIPGAVLSSREREVLSLLAHGLDAAEVARHLYLGAETIRTHVQNAIRKLGARTRTEAVVIAVESGEIHARGDLSRGELPARAQAREPRRG